LHHDPRAGAILRCLVCVVLQSVWLGQ